MYHLVHFMFILMFMGSSQALNLDNPIKYVQLFKNELKMREIIDQAKNYLETLEEFKASLESYFTSHDAVRRALQHHNVSHPDDLDKLERQGSILIEEVLVSDVLHLFGLVQRCTKLVHPVVKHLQQVLMSDFKNFCSRVSDLGYECQEVVGWYRQLTKLLIVPDESDRDHISLALGRIQHTHQLDAYDMARGKIGQRQSEMKLTPSDCSTIAMERFQQKPALYEPKHPEYALAIEWLEAGFRLSKEVHGDFHQTTKQLHQNLMGVRMQHDMQYKMQTCISPFFFGRKIGQDMTETGRSIRMWERENLNLDRCNITDKFNLICGGHKVQDDSSKSRCYLDVKNDPFYYLDPFKIEEIGNENFTIYLLHDFLRDPMIDYMKYDLAEEAKTQFQRSKVGSKGEGLSLGRTQASAFVDEHHIPKLAPVSRKLKAATGLHVASALEIPHLIYVSSPYQLGTYLPGGMHNNHYDNGYNNTLESEYEDGRFIGTVGATAMFFLSGADTARTAFPEVGQFVTATKGSVAFWWNNHPDGSQIPESMHGGCPVLFGTKWIVNKWIRDGAQFHTRPCSAKVGSK